MTAIGRVEDAVRRLSKGRTTALTPELRERAEAFEGLDTFADYFDLVVDAELSGEFHKFGHGKRTKKPKAYFHKREADLGSALIGAAFPQIEIDKTHPGPLGDYDEALVDTAHKSLVEDGYFVWPTPLDEALIDGMIEDVRETPFRERGTGVIVNGYSEETVHACTANRVEIASDLGLLGKENFERLATDPMAIDIVQRTLEACPVFAGYNIWWNIGMTQDERELSRAAQLFHQDKDWIKWIKAFVYLTDVDEDTGPHVYVQGSHIDYAERFGDRPKFSSRFTDVQVSGLFGEQRIKPLTGKRGTMIFADTSGLHKGAAVLRNHRFLLQLEWACSLFMSPSPALDERLLSPSSLTMRAQNPRFFAQFDHNAREDFLQDRDAAGKGRGLVGKLAHSIKKRLPI